MSEIQEILNYNWQNRIKHQHQSKNCYRRFSVEIIFLL